MFFSVRAQRFRSSVHHSRGLAAEGGGSGRGDPRDRGDPAVRDAAAGGQPDHLSLQGKAELTAVAWTHALIVLQSGGCFMTFDVVGGRGLNSIGTC